MVAWLAGRKDFGRYCAKGICDTLPMFETPIFDGLKHLLSFNLAQTVILSLSGELC